MSKFFKVLIIFISVIFIISISLDYWIVKNENFLKHTEINSTIKIEKNEPANITYDKIFKNLKTPPFFKYYLYYVYHFPKNRKFGEYKFENDTLKKVLSDIKKGKTVKIKITIPEGFNIYDIAKILDKKKLANYNDFVASANDPDLVMKIIKKNYKTFEGFLYPETYFFSKNLPITSILSKMYSVFRTKLPENFEQEVNKNGLTFYEGLILASIIQKETYMEDEYPLIASVFYNRLKKHMRLQSDPTVIYGIFTRFNGNLQKKHLTDKSNPYNTYQINGLPPTPICNPSKKAMLAVMYPAKTDFLYFVADKNGIHHFSKTYKEHKRKVYKYQILKK